MILTGALSPVPSLPYPGERGQGGTDFALIDVALKIETHTRLHSSRLKIATVRDTIKEFRPETLTVNKRITVAILRTSSSHAIRHLPGGAY